jgi:amidase
MEDFLSRVPEVDLAGYLKGFAERLGIARQWSQFAERYPLVLGPVSTEPPFPVGRDLEGPDASWGIFRSMRLVVAVNLLGLPAAVVPVGAANGLPQGVQVIGAL